MFAVSRDVMQAVILGREFLRKAKIVPDVANGVWTSRRLPGKEIPFDLQMSTMACLAAGMHVWRESLEKSACPSAYQAHLLDALNLHANTFQRKPRVSKGVKLVIDTGTSKPVQIPMRPMTDAKRKIVEEQLQEWIAEGLIEKSKSP